MTELRDIEFAIANFHEHGWARLRGVFDADAASAMRDAAWDGLRAMGIKRDCSTSWTIERPTNLQSVRRHAAFQAVGGNSLVHAISEILGSRDWVRPSNWGSLFISFPIQTGWQLPHKGWHVDANLLGSHNPVGGVKTFALFGDVEPKGGATLLLSGSHRLIAEWFAKRPQPSGLRNQDQLKLLSQHPYIRDLHVQGDSLARRQRFMEMEQILDGINLKVVEATGSAGDIYIIHPLLLHAQSPNTLDKPRFMLSGGVTTNLWGWDISNS